ncbi:MAG: PEP-CTERM sorting domain-containing protein, partial [Planctomycetota bacterium]
NPFSQQPIISDGSDRSSIFADNSSGDGFQFNRLTSSLLALSENGFTGDVWSGSGTATWFNTDLATGRSRSLQLIPGTHQLVLANAPANTITVNVGITTAVPEPSSFLIFGCGIQLVLWRRKRTGMAMHAN